MKKLILFLLPLLALAQNPTNFPYGIKNPAATSDSAPAYFTTTQVDGVHKKTPAALVAKTATVNDSLATKENVANKSDSYTSSSSTTYASTKALVDGLVVKNWIKSNESLSLAQRKGDVLYGILDQYIGEEMTLSKVTGTPTVDNIIYFQLGTEYFKRNLSFLNASWFGIVGDGVIATGGGTDNLIAFNKCYSAAKLLNVKVVIPCGIYAVSNTSVITDWDGCNIEGENASIIKKGLVKLPNESILEIRSCEGVKIAGLSFYGAEPTTNGAILAGDYGVLIGDCTNIEIQQNKFFNFGDSAFKIATMDTDSISVTSSNIWIHHNYIKNCFQTSTTYHGGSSNILFSYNIIIGMKGSVKFATRIPGANNVKVDSNLILQSRGQAGIEIASYSDYSITNNTISADLGFTAPPGGIFHYATAGTTVGQDMKNIMIKGNTIAGFESGIRIDNQAYSDGTVFVLENIVIESNNILNSRGPTYRGAIFILAKKLRGLTIINNKIQDCAAHGIAFDFEADSLVSNQEITIQGNSFKNVIQNCIQISPTNVLVLKRVRIVGNYGSIGLMNQFIRITSLEDSEIINNSAITAGVGIFTPSCKNTIIIANNIKTTGTNYAIFPAGDGGFVHDNIVDTSGTVALRFEAFYLSGVWYEKGSIVKNGTIGFVGTGQVVKREIKGTASLSANGILTEFTVTHNGNFVPEQIILTPTSSSTGYYISAKTTTTFTITFGTPPATGTVTFDWIVK